MDERTVGDLIGRYRSARRISQSQLAELCDLDHSYISRMEAGKRMPSRATLTDIARALDLEFSEKETLFEVAGFWLEPDPVVSSFARALRHPLLSDRTRDLIKGQVSGLLRYAHDEVVAAKRREVLGTDNL